MTDILIFNEDDGGNVEILAGRPTMSDGYEVAAYLSMFGGNERDSGLDDGDRLQWWGNLSEPNPVRRYRSETQHLLRSLPAVPANLKRLEDAAERDLAWFVEESVATLITVSARIPALNRIKLDVQIVIDGIARAFSVERHWSFQG